MFEKMIAHLPTETLNIEAEVEAKAQIKKLKSLHRKKKNSSKKQKRPMRILIKR